MKLLKNVRVETGHLYTPSGEEYSGFKVTIGHILDPSEVKKTYDDIEAIFHSNQVNFKTHEETTPSGHFHSYSVSTN